MPQIEVSEAEIEAAARAIYHAACGTETPRYKFNVDLLPSDWTIYFDQARVALKAVKDGCVTYPFTVDYVDEKE